MTLVTSTVEFVVILAVLAAALLSMGGCASTPEAYGATFQAEKQTRDGKESEVPDPTPSTLYATARIFQAQNNDQMAEVVLMGLVRDFPEFKASYNDLAGIRIERGAFADASAVLHLGLKYTPDDAVLLNNAGVCA